MLQRLRPIMLLLGSLAAALLGCEEPPRPAPSLEKQEKLRVVATVYPLADLARQIGGDWIAVEWLSESGQPLPGDQPPPSDVFNRIRVSDVVISSGEPWAVEGFDDPLRLGRVVRLDVLPAATQAPSPAGLMWLDPLVMREAAEELYKSFSAKHPKLEPHFRQRADAFIEQLDDLMRHYEPVLQTTPPRTALVLSADWKRLLFRFGIAQRGLPDAGAAGLTSSQVRQLIEEARQHRTTSLFVSTETPPAVITDLQNRTDLTVRTLERQGTSAGVGRNTYLQILRHNLDQLHQGASRPPR